MYNRYIPQPDGSFRRSRVPDTGTMPEREDHKGEPEACSPEPEKPLCSSAPDIEPCRNEPQQKPEPRNREQPQRQSPCRRPNHRPQCQTPPRQSRPSGKQESSCEQKDNSVGSFLRQLMPKDFDTGDLLIVLLLLLMSGDCAEDQNSALLTLVLYLFM